MSTADRPADDRRDGKRCPECGADCERDMVDVGVCEIPSGPWGCPECHWVEAIADCALVVALAPASAVAIPLEVAAELYLCAHCSRAVHPVISSCVLDSGTTWTCAECGEKTVVSLSGIEASAVTVPSAREEAAKRCGAVSGQFACDRDHGHAGVHRGYNIQIDEPIFWNNLG